MAHRVKYSQNHSTVIPLLNVMAEAESLNGIVEFIHKNDSTRFKSHIKDLPEDVTEMTDLLDDKEKERAIRWCRDKGVYLIHKVFTTVNGIDSITFLKKNLTYYKLNHLLDPENRTWLHTAVFANRNRAVLEFLIIDIFIDVEQPDIYNYTALHMACQKLDHVEGELDILIKKSNQLIVQSLDDVTPLELACGDRKKLKNIQKNSHVNLKELLETIDNISKGLPQTEDYYYNDQISNEKIWSMLLQKNDKYRLVNALRKDLGFGHRFYLSSKECINVVRQCHENGQEILTYIKTRFPLNDSSISSLEKVFIGISGLTPKWSDGEHNVDHKRTNIFHNSGLFLALITGRFKLVHPLLTCCQFEIIPYALVTSLICQILLLTKCFPDQNQENIHRLKDLCELYAIEVLNRVAIRDPTTTKKSIYEFLNKSKFMNRTILDIAYMGKCSRFLSLPKGI